jgi:hypothetical protein
MKQRVAVSIALALSAVFVSLMSSDSTAQAQQRQRFRADTGMITLGTNQVLRLTVTTLFDPDNHGPTIIGIGHIDYVQTNCTAGTCKHAPVDPNPVFERYDIIVDVISKDIPLKPGSSGVRGIVFSLSRNVRVTAAIINTVTGETTSHIIIANTDGDVH